MTDKNIEKSLVYVGIYSESAGESIFLYEIDNFTGELHFIKSFAGGKNPSYMTFDKNRNHLYAANETVDFADKNSGAISTFAVDHQTGFLTLIQKVSSRGKLPVQITMNEDGKTILVANYKSGNIAVFPVNPDGSLGAESDLKQHEGRSVNNERQNSPHAHFVIFSPDSRFVFAVDLGLDKILRYNVETKNGISKLTNQTIAFNCTPGTGPRQMCFHPNGKYAYLIHELKSIIVALLYDSERGLFTEMQMIATIPENFTAKNKCGGIKVSSDGKYLYGSNRGHDSIVVFAIDSDEGKLSHLENILSGGEWPREFTIDPTGNFLLVANQHSDVITTFKRDKISGKLEQKIQEVKVEKPAFIKVVPMFEKN